MEFGKLISTIVISSVSYPWCPQDKLRERLDAMKQAVASRSGTPDRKANDDESESESDKGSHRRARSIRLPDGSPK